MSLREEELVMLFETIDAMIDAKIFRTSESKRHEAKLKQDCINLIAFGEPPEE